MSDEQGIWIDRREVATVMWLIGYCEGNRRAEVPDRVRALADRLDPQQQDLTSGSQREA